MPFVACRVTRFLPFATGMPPPPKLTGIPDSNMPAAVAALIAA